MHTSNQKLFKKAIQYLINNEYTIALNLFFQLKLNNFVEDKIDAYIGFVLYKLKNHELAATYIKKSIDFKTSHILIKSISIDLQKLYGDIAKKCLHNHTPSQEKKYKVDLYSDYLTRNGCKILHAANVYSRLEKENHRTCHIIGSGWSLSNGLHKIRKDDFVMGFNFAGYADVHFDFYFVEFCGFSNELLKNKSALQINLIQNFISKDTKNIFFKNLWEDKNDILSISKIYKNFFIIKDYLLDTKNIRKEHLISTLLFKDNHYIKQAYSTSITCILTAYHSGFKKIILHGIDFIGPHFFKLPEFNNPRSLALPMMKYRHSPIQSNNQKQYIIPGPGVYNQAQILGELGDTFKSHNIELMTASAISPSSQLLPIYNI